jgi:hypothetical protein
LVHDFWVGHTMSALLERTRMRYLRAKGTSPSNADVIKCTLHITVAVDSGKPLVKIPAKKLENHVYCHSWLCAKGFTVSVNEWSGDLTVSGWAAP